MKFTKLPLLLLFIHCSLFADGKVISRMKQLPSIPDQQAVLIWDKESKTETLGTPQPSVMAGNLRILSHSDKAILAWGKRSDALCRVRVVQSTLKEWN